MIDPVKGTPIPRTIAHFAVERPVAVIMVYLAIAAFGLVALARIPIDLMPRIEPPSLSVITVYPGAGAADVEENVSKIIEESLGALGNLEEIRSSSRENVSIVNLKFSFRTDLDGAASDIRQSLELVVDSLPGDAQTPIIYRFNTDSLPVFVFAVTSTGGDISDDREYIRDHVVEPLKRIPGVGSVAIHNAPEKQLLVEVDRQRMEARGLNLERVAQVLAAENLSVPAGYMEVGKSDFPIRVPGELDSPEEVGKVVLSMGADGGVVRLDDIATVRLGRGESKEDVQVNRVPAIMGSVSKQSDANTVEVSKQVQRRLAEVGMALPAHLEVHQLVDSSEFIVGMIDSIKLAILVGGGLVILVVLLFLRNWRSTLIVVLSLPASVMIAFLLLYLRGYTLNAISMIAIAISIGMVVDNAIVVLENISRHMEEGMDAKMASIVGPYEVGGAIFASTLTSVVIFAPLIFVGGLLGVLFEQLAFVVVATLVGSLVTARLLVPTLCVILLSNQVAGGAAVVKGAGGRFTPAEGRFSLSALYRSLLTFSLKRNWLVMGLSLCLAGLAVLLAMWVGMDFFPRQDTGDIQVVAELRSTARLSDCVAVGQIIDERVRRQPEVDLAYTRAGSSASGFAAAAGRRQGHNIVQVNVRLKGKHLRNRRDEAVAASIREDLQDIPEIESLAVNSGDPVQDILFGGGRPIAVQILGQNYQEMESLAKEIAQMMHAVDGVSDVIAELPKTRPEVRLVLDRDRASRLGVPVAVAGGALRSALHGRQVTRYRADGEDVDMVVRLREEDRKDLRLLEEFVVPNLVGQPVRLGSLGRVEEGEATTEIIRKDGQRTVAVTASNEGRSLAEVAADIELGMEGMTIPQGITVTLGGEVESMRESVGDIAIVLILGMALVFMVMAGQFESLLHPFVVMFSVPFGFTGALLALILSGTTLSLAAFLGLVILVGIVVNNAIVLVDCINALRAEGMPVKDAVVTAGTRRLRPVLMTTITTVCGMMPMALSRGMGAELWVPIGRAAVGGLLLSTLVTLVLVPAAYLLMERARERVMGRRSSGTKPQPELC